MGQVDEPGSPGAADSYQEANSNEAEPEISRVCIGAGRPTYDHEGKLHEHSWEILEKLMLREVGSARTKERMAVHEWIRLAVGSPGDETTVEANRVLNKIGFKLSRRDGEWLLIISNAMTIPTGMFDDPVNYQLTGRLPVWVYHLRTIIDENADELDGFIQDDEFVAEECPPTYFAGHRVARGTAIPLRLIMEPPNGACATEAENDLYV